MLKIPTDPAPNSKDSVQHCFRRYQLIPSLSLVRHALGRRHGRQPQFRRLQEDQHGFREFEDDGDGDDLIFYSFRGRNEV